MKIARKIKPTTRIIQVEDPFKVRKNRTKVKNSVPTPTSAKIKIKSYSGDLVVVRFRDGEIKIFPVESAHWAKQLVKILKSAPDVTDVVHGWGE